MHLLDLELVGRSSKEKGLPAAVRPQLPTCIGLAKLWHCIGRHKSRIGKLGNREWGSSLCFEEMIENA